MKCYVIANYNIDVNKLNEYSDYPQVAAQTTYQYGGRVLVATNNSQCLEGDPAKITVVLEFDSRANAERWYKSKEYNEIKNIRVQAMTDGWLLLSDEFKAP